MKKGLRHLILAALLVSSLCSCLKTTQSFNHGKLLNPGEGLLTYGYGKKSSDIRVTNWDYDYDNYDTLTLNWTRHCLDFRLGFLSQYPLGKGVEIGFLLEWSGPQKQGEWEYIIEGPPTIEFSTRLGLPQREFFGALYHHNIELGWQVGGWVDNGWYMGYAAGLEYERIIPYICIRAVLSPTDIFTDEVYFDDDFFSKHNRSFFMRYSLGTSIKLSQMKLIPDFITPEISIFHPNFSIKRDIGLTWHVGFRWMNGI